MARRRRGYLGNPAAKTPNLDRLVKTDAVAFEWAFCQSPVSTPSRCSFMSGWYPHVRGHRTMYHMLHPDRGEPMLLKTLKDAGYFVWWGGKNDVVPAQEGFEAFCDVKYHPPQRVIPDDAGTQWRGSPHGDNYYSFYRGRLDVPRGMRHPNDTDWAMVEGAVEFIRNAGRRISDEQQPFCLYLPLT